MKRYLVLLFTSLFLWFSTYAQPQAEDVSKALNGGNVQNIFKYFDNVLDVTINDDQTTYSKAQAEEVVKGFLTRNSAKSFEVLHDGAKNESSYFVIGQLKGKGRIVYRVYLAFKLKDKHYVLQQIKFER
jgi:hypothetical protein